MKKILCLTWLFMQLPLVSPTKMVINNLELKIISEENLEGFLFRDDKLIQEIKKDSYMENQVIIDPIEPGIYTLYDKNGKSIAQEIYSDDNTHVAFDCMVRSKKDNHYLFQEKPKVVLVSPNIDHRYKYEEINGYYLYEFDDEKIEFIDQTYFIHVDDTVPNVTFDKMNELESFVFVTNKSTIHLSYQDTYPEMFTYLNNNEITIQLHEGINDISCYFMDLAENKIHEKVWVIYDNQAPTIYENEDLNINSPKTIFIDEAHLDLKNSFITKNNEEIIPLNSNEFILDDSGKFEFKLLDLAGNENVFCLNVNYDRTLPNIMTDLKDQKLYIQYTESLKTQDLKLMYGNSEIEILNQQATLEKEGFYYLQGVLVDLAGNKNFINKELRVDYQKPNIFSNVDQDVYLVFPKLNLKIGDIFDIEWRIELYQNDELIGNLEGAGNIVVDDFLKKFDLKNSNGEFLIKITSSDGIYENELTKVFVIDERCEDIELTINGYNANQVDEILVNNDIVLDAYCSEGEVFYRLFKNNEVVREDIMKSLTVTNKELYSKIELVASDAYGHRTTKIIRFDYPQVDQLFSFEVKEEISDKDAANESEIVLDRLETTEIKEVQKTDKGLFYIILGGVASVLIIIRMFLYAKNRYRKNKKDLSREQTVLLQDSKDTQCLSNTSSL